MIMKVLNAEQIRSADAYTINNEPILSIDLMERAAKACYTWIKNNIDKNKEIFVFCGMGNNGGDGLAISRMLLKSGYSVTVLKILHKEKASEDFQINEKRLQKLKTAKYLDVNKYEEIPPIPAAAVVVDAMLGSGLNSPLKGLLAEIVAHINKLAADIISIDLPSGLFCENNTQNVPDSIIMATHTLSFQVPKLAFFLNENERFVGKWHILDIGLDENFINSIDSDYLTVTKDMLRPFFRRRRNFAHKGDFGHALLLAGSRGKSGAAILAANAAIRSGLGLLTVSTPASCYIPIQTAVPEAMCLVDDNDTCICCLADISGYNVVGAGPGIGLEKQTHNVIKLLIQNSAKPLVLDADALNIVAENPTWLSFLPKFSILTPHPGEMDRITGKVESGFERLQKARECALKYSIYIVLKGAYTAIVCPDGKVFFNMTGNPGMATGGSGDVLTGIILSLLAQGYLPGESALMGVYLHGLSGDIAATRYSLEALKAGDIIDNIGKAIKKTFY